MMRENESDDEDQTAQYVSPWAPRTDWGGEAGGANEPAGNESTENGDDWLPSFYPGPGPGSATSPAHEAAYDPPHNPAYGPPHGSSYGPPGYGPPGYGPPGYGPPGYGPPGYGQPDYGRQPPDWGNWIPDYRYGPPPPPRSWRGGRLLIYGVIAVLAASISAGATVALNRSSASSSTGVSTHENIPAQHNNASSSGSRASLNQVKVESKVEPGLVDVTSTLKYNSETAEGTGMIVASDGLVLTNNHVIDDSTSVVVRLVDSQRTYQAQVLGYDASGDIALLKLQGASGLPTVSLGNSNQVSIGSPVLALGNAEGRGGATPAAGTVNALHSSIRASDSGSGATENLHNMLQISAKIQQGDSGGALANNAGQIIGMITAANTPSSPADGTIGFAIPINTAVSVARQIASGTASSTVYIGTPGFLGVVLPQSTSSNPQQQARDEQNALHQQSNDNGGGSDNSCVENNSQLGVPARVAPASTGVLIAGEFCGTAVSNAGLSPGDVITSVEGKAVTTPDSLHNLTANYHPGEVISIGWEDTSGGRHTTEVTLGPGPVR